MAKNSFRTKGEARSMGAGLTKTTRRSQRRWQWPPQARSVGSQWQKQTLTEHDHDDKTSTSAALVSASRVAPVSAPTSTTSAKIPTPTTDQLVLYPCTSTHTWILVAFSTAPFCVWGLGVNVDDGEYAIDRILYQQDLARRRRPSANYMLKQIDINARMREILIDWLADVTTNEVFNVCDETLCLCVNYIDRFLERKQVARNRLQLVGIVALCIATKYEEVKVIKMEAFADVCNGAYQVEEVIKMECAMLQVLEFNLVVATPIAFMQHFARVASLDESQRHLAAYLVEATLQTEGMLQFSASCCGAAAVYLAQWYTSSRAQEQASTVDSSIALGTNMSASPSVKSSATSPSASTVAASSSMSPVWVPIAQSDFDEDDKMFCACVLAIHSIVANPTPFFTAVRRKYSVPKFGSVTTTLKPVAPPMVSTPNASASAVATRSGATTAASAAASAISTETFVVHVTTTEKTTPKPLIHSSDAKNTPKKTPYLNTGSLPGTVPAGFSK